MIETMKPHEILLFSRSKIKQCGFLYLTVKINTSYFMVQAKTNLYSSRYLSISSTNMDKVLGRGAVLFTT